MRVKESFEIAERPDRVWDLFSQPEQVAACVPGVESVEPLDDDNLRVQLTQSVGPMTATFALKMTITERVDNEALSFTAVGRVVRGASGSVRSTNRVQLKPLGDSRTRVNVDAEIAMGGMLGSVGQKVIAGQAETVTEDFARSLERALRGEPPQAGVEEPEREITSAGGGPPPLPGGASGGLTVDVSDWRVLSAGVAVLMLIAWLAGRSTGATAASARLVKKGYIQ